MPKFVILRHEIGPEHARESDAPMHFDWMFQVDNELQTWSTLPVDDFTHGLELDALRLANHRLAYLEITGDIGGNRGTVQPVLRGTFTLVENSDVLFKAILDWNDKDGPHRPTVVIQRSCTSSDGERSGKEARCLLRLGE